MITFIVFVAFLGFFLLYNTSKKADLKPSSQLEKWAQNHLQPSKYIGCVLLAFALAMSIVHFGAGSGIFAFFVILMTVGSFIILIVPLKYMNYKLASIVFLLSILAELICK